MLPPIPQGLHPVTSQHDVEKPKPAIAPVVPVKKMPKAQSWGSKKMSFRLHNNARAKNSVDASNASTRAKSKQRMSMMRIVSMTKRVSYRVKASGLM